MRIKWIDSCKGFAIMLVVLGHMAMGLSTAGSFPSYGSFLEVLLRVVYSFHMPLFWMLAGYTFYLAYCKNRGSRKGKLKSQLINTVFVYFLYSTLQWCIQYVFSSYTNSSVSVKDLLLMPIRPMSPFWFTFVLVFYYLFFFVFEKVNIPEYLKLILITAISALGNPLDLDIVFPIRLILLHALFFYLGIFFAKKGRMIADSKAAFSVLMIAGGGLLVLYFFVDVPYIPLVSDVLMPSVLGLAFMNLFCRVSILKENRFFSFIGGCTLEIYVVHCIIVACARSVLPALGITNFFAVLLIGCALGIFLPVVWAIALKKLRLHDLFFSPTRLFKKK